MSAFFSSGHAVDLVLLVILAEFAFLNLRRSSGLRTATWLDRALALAPGALILLALRAALTGAPWPWIAGLLAASFPIHLWDVARRRL
ncbi:hypothetical protein BH09PSE2_BH09PSE2_25650 [soil metagenome]